MKISIIITAKKEPDTVGALISAIENDLENGFENRKIGHCEILLVCPDQQTKQAGLNNDRLDLVNWVQDPGQGKPTALNLAFEEAKGDVLVLTDGDLQWVKGSLKSLVDRFNDQTGLVTGHPLPINERDNLFGFWAHFLTDAADWQRRERLDKGLYFDASGYLLAIKKELVEPMPENILVDDAYLSRLVWTKEKKISYASQAKIKVKFPTNFSDWIKQKKRTLSGYVQLSQMRVVPLKERSRSFREECRGINLFFTYSSRLIEYWWTFLLFFARLWVWLLVVVDRKLLKRKYLGNWARIESTK